MHNHNRPGLLSRRKLSGLQAGLTLLLTLALLAGCANAATPAPTTAPAAPTTAPAAPTTAPVAPTVAPEPTSAEPVTIRWLMFYPDVANDKAWNGEIELFNSTHPGMKLEIIGVGWNDFTPKLQAMVAAGDSLDIVSLQQEALYVAKDFVMPLDDLIAQDSLDLNHFLPGAAEPAYDGKIYGFRHDSAFWMLYYNKDIFDAAGIDYPPATGWTFDEFMNTACQLTNPDEGIWGMHNVNWLTGYLIQQQGLPYRDIVDGTPKVLIDSPETMAFYQRLADFINKDNCQPTTDQNTSLGNADVFLLGKAAMQFNGNWAFSGLKENAQFNYGVAPLPGLKQPNSGMKIGIVSSTKNVEAAWEFLKWLTYEPEASRYRAEKGMGQPAIDDEQANDTFLNGPTSPEGLANVFAVISDPQNLITVLDVPGVAEADGIINPETDQVMNGLAQAVDVIPEAVKKANEAMKEVWDKETGE